MLRHRDEYNEKGLYAKWKRHEITRIGERSSRGMRMQSLSHRLEGGQINKTIMVEGQPLHLIIIKMTGN